MVKLDSSGSDPSLGESRVLACLTKVSNPPLRKTQHCSLSVWLLLHSQCHTSSWRMRCLSKHFHSYQQTSLIPPCALYHNKPHGNIPLLSVSYLQNVFRSGKGGTPYPFVTVYGILDHHSSWRISPECLESDCGLCWIRQQLVFRVCGMLRWGILWCSVLRLSLWGNVNQSRHKFRKNDGTTAELNLKIIILSLKPVLCVIMRGSFQHAGRFSWIYVNKCFSIVGALFISYGVDYE